MGCHTWIYKKVKNIDKKYLIAELDKRRNSYSNRSLTETKEEYLKRIVDMYKEKSQSYADSKVSKKDINYQIAIEFSDPVKVAKMYDEIKANEILREQLYQDFVNSPKLSPKDFIKAYKAWGGDSSALIRFYKHNWYLHTTFDTYFRCYEWGEKSIDTYEDMIDWLNSVPANNIHCYGQFDENGNFICFNDKTYEPIIGLSEELKNVLTHLYKNNDIFIEFG